MQKKKKTTREQPKYCLMWNISSTIVQKTNYWSQNSAGFKSPVVSIAIWLLEFLDCSNDKVYHPFRSVTVTLSDRVLLTNSFQDRERQQPYSKERWPEQVVCLILLGSSLFRSFHRICGLHTDSKVSQMSLDRQKSRDWSKGNQKWDENRGNNKCCT